jgi:hypothetical protein
MSRRKLQLGWDRGLSGKERDVDGPLRVDQTTIQVGGDDSSRAALNMAESAGG